MTFAVAEICGIESKFVALVKYQTFANKLMNLKNFPCSW